MKVFLFILLLVSFLGSAASVWGAIESAVFNPNWAMGWAILAIGQGLLAGACAVSLIGGIDE